MTTKDKGRADQDATPKHDHGGIISSVWGAITRRLWVMAYCLEDARQRYASRKKGARK